MSEIHIGRVVSEAVRGVRRPVVDALLAARAVEVAAHEAALAVWTEENTLALAARTRFEAANPEPLERWGKEWLAWAREYNALAQAMPAKPWLAPCPVAPNLDVRAEVRCALGKARLSPAQAAEVDRLEALVRARLDLAGPEVPSVLYIQRLEARRVRLIQRGVADAYDACGYRRAESKWAGGDHKVTVSVIAFGYPHAEGGTTVAWSNNRKWKGHDSYAQLTVCADWRRTVGAAGIATVDGLLTLRADAIPFAEGRAWNATWVRQGRGCALTTESGVIVELPNGQRAHAKSVEHARKLLHARSDADREAIREARLAQRTADLDRRSTSLEAWSVSELETEIVITDSTSAGNCEPGTEDWVERHLPDRTRATVGEVMAVALQSQDRVPWVVRACLFAIRRARRAVKAVA